MTERREQERHSCRVLQSLISRETREDIKLMLLDDLLWKASRLQPDELERHKIAASKHFLPECVLERISKGGESDMRTYKDIAIVTIKQEELKATKLAFGIERDTEDTQANGLPIWKGTLDNKAAGRKLDLIVTMVGKQGPDDCASACSRILNKYKVGLCVLVGIAAGLKKKVELGDVVATNVIVGYEMQALDEDGPKYRPEHKPVWLRLLRRLHYFTALEGDDWRDTFCELLAAFDKEKRSIDDLVDISTLEPSMHISPILSGSKLFRDDSLDNMRIQLHDKIRAAEMEAIGFATMCNEYETPWLVFRGISDHGDSNKKKTKAFQIIASLAAACCTRKFLEAAYPTPSREF